MQTNSTHPLTEEVTVIETTPIIDKGNLPVILVDQNGKILFANPASFALFNDLFNLKNEYIPKDFIQKIPGMLNLNADFSVPLEVSSKTMTFDVIGFEECGYIGLYAHVGTAA